MKEKKIESLFPILNIIRLSSISNRTFNFNSSKKEKQFIP